VVLRWNIYGQTHGFRFLGFLRAAAFPDQSTKQYQSKSCPDHYCWRSESPVFLNEAHILFSGWRMSMASKSLSPWKWRSSMARCSDSSPMFGDNSPKFQSYSAEQEVLWFVRRYKVLHGFIWMILPDWFERAGVAARIRLVGTALTLSLWGILFPLMMRHIWVESSFCHCNSF